MDFTVTVPDTLITSVVAAANRINDRLPADQRQPTPITLEAKDIQAFVQNHLGSILRSDLEQDVQLTGKKTVSDAQVIIDGELDTITVK